MRIGGGVEGNENFTEAGRMYVAGFIISSTMPMSLSLLETAALVKNLAQNLTFPLLVSANTRSKCKQQP